MERLGRAVTDLAYLAGVESAYVVRFRTTVTALPPGAVVLERTYFYPTGGGQPCDLGRISATDGRAFAVQDVRKSGPAVYHRVAPSPGSSGGPLGVGEEVEGEIDWSRRHRHMRLHTGQHLLSALVFAQTGLKTGKASFSGNGGTIDLDGAAPSGAALARVAEELHAVITRGASVVVRNVPRSEWDLHPSARSGLVPLAPQVDPVRVIEVDGIDSCPCGGTHVRVTSEVGPVRLAAPNPATPDRLAFTLPAGGPTTPSA